ncbi:MAG: divalent-cation tolerance protein CutA [Alphaproteobacteria bacterium]
MIISELINKNAIVLYTTVSTEQEASQLAESAILNKLAVCVNIIPNGKSIYLWEGNAEHAHEHYMLFKTTKNLIDKLEKFILANHPYQLPAIFKFNAECSEKFMDYMRLITP